MVVEPGDDLGVRAGCAVGAGQPVVREVGLPALVGLVRFEADVGGLGSLPGLGGDRSCAGQDPVDRGFGQDGLMGVFQVPGNGLGV